MERVNVTIIGGGVIGLAIGVELTRTCTDVCLIERHPHPGMETSSRNSGVIHAGLYYPPGSNKARHCVRGRQLLYEFCETYAIPYRRCGKLIVAGDAHEAPILEQLQKRAAQNGVDDLRFLDGKEISRREPHVKAYAALVSPSTGILEAEVLTRTLTRLFVEQGGYLLTGTSVTAGESHNGNLRLRTERESILTRVVVNAAGLFADDVAQMLGTGGFRIYPCRGEYATFIPSRRHLINALVYPVPPASGHGLGTHLTKTIGGECLIGPTICYQSSKTDYDENRLPVEEFHRAAEYLLPELRLSDLRLGYSGIRAKLHPASESFADFLIGPDPANPHIIQVAGIDSPGLTSALSIAKEVGGHLRSMVG